MVMLKIMIFFSLLALFFVFSWLWHWVWFGRGGDFFTRHTASWPGLRNRQSPTEKAFVQKVIRFSLVALVTADLAGMYAAIYFLLS